MKEWPKKLPVEVDLGDGAYSTDKVEVIPADLGRELYEALTAAVAELELEFSPTRGGWPEYAAMQDALARYEREVGG